MEISIVARVWRFARGDGGLALSVARLALFLFALHPTTGVGAVAPRRFDAAFAGVLAADGLFIFEPRPIVRAFVALVVVTLAARLAFHAMPSRGVETPEAARRGGAAATDPREP